MDEHKLREQSELEYSSIFNQIQNSGDIISSILLIFKFITDNNISVNFDTTKLRSIALRSSDKETSTYLWHINALIAASSDFKHLMLGIEMMFDRFLGNKNVFIKEKHRQKSTILTPNKSKNKNKFIGNEVISVVNTFYEENNINQNSDHELNEIHSKLQHMSIENKNKNNHKNNHKNAPIKKNINALNTNVNDENKEYMNKYCGKISSPISFRMRQQKRLIQNERRVNSRTMSRTKSLDVDYINSMSYKFNDNHEINEKITDVSPSHSSNYEPEILSPFNVSKFAKIVDFEQ